MIDRRKFNVLMVPNKNCQCRVGNKQLTSNLAKSLIALFLQSALVLRCCNVGLLYESQIVQVLNMLNLEVECKCIKAGVVVHKDYLHKLHCIPSLESWA